MGELPYGAVTPDGYPDVAAAWSGPGLALERIQFAFRLADGHVKGSRAGGGGTRVALELAAPEFQWQ
jgi:hypothetical protein